MDFEVIGEITDVETFATGTSIRELPRLRRVYGPGRWRKRKAWPASGFPTARNAAPRYTGMRPTALGGRN
jgi:hypothetical protein